MITTVTTTTTTLGGATSLALVAVGTLLILLIKKELVLSTGHAWSQRVGEALNVAIVPLMMVLVMTVITKVVSALG